MASSSTHTRKRQYQPSNQTTLNSYFGRHAGTNTCQPRSPMSPPLPEDIQSSLVNVGMRVRKAMSDRYPTHKATGLASSATPPMSSAPVRPMVRQELQPFCGLHKTGGLSVQPPASSAPAAMRRAAQDYEDDDEEDDDVPRLSMSQSTIPSTQTSFMSAASSSNVKKRAYEDEAENDMDAFFDESDLTYDEAMEQSIAPRRMAPMKASTRKTNANQLVHIVDDDGDFPEADFLMPMEVEKCPER